MESTLMQQGLALMLYGMGTVFVFLALLVVATQGMSILLRNYIKESMTTPGKNIAGPVVAVEDPRLVAVISAAIHQHRSRTNSDNYSRHQ